MDLQTVAENLRKRRFEVTLAPNAAQAVQCALTLIPRGASVGFGGSATVKQLALDDALLANGCAIYAHGYVKPDQADRLYDLASRADWYIASANALTESGDIVNVDGTANRVASLIYGVKNVLYVIGKNKIVPDLDAAIDRVRNVVAPRNAKRLNRDVPCAQSGVCSYCDAPQCICNVTTIVHHPTKYQNRAHIVLIDEDLGM